MTEYTLTDKRIGIVCSQCGEAVFVVDYDDSSKCIGCGANKRDHLMRVNGITARSNYITAVVYAARMSMEARELRDGLALPNGATPMMAARWLIEMESTVAKLRLKLEEAYKECGMSLPNEETVLKYGVVGRKLTHTERG